MIPFRYSPLGSSIKFFTFTINAVPTNAVVKINNVVRNSIYTKVGTTINWEVSLNGYITQSGTEVLNSNIVKNIELKPADPFTPGSIVIPEVANPQSTVISNELIVSVPNTIFKVWCIAGGNSYKWCYIGCNWAASGAGFIGKIKINTPCKLRLITGAQRVASDLQVADINSDTWYSIILANACTDTGTDPRWSVGSIVVNRNSTFNTYLDIELESNGNTGSQSAYGASVWNGYGSGATNGYTQLQYIGLAT